MFKANKKYVLLFMIFAFAFIYRLLLMLWEKYPSGADIGLHNSVIYSITQSGNTDFLWNYYQIGGGLSLTFPGYHIFVSYFMMITGMPDYQVHAVIVSLFSSMLVLCTFLITRAMWRESTALIAAFLVAISRFDLEMLLWGGYPNTLALLLIPLVLYLYLQRDRFSLKPFLVTTSILSGSIFLTHSLSAGIFAGIITVMSFFVIIFPKKLGGNRKRVLNWLSPMFVGVVLALPFLVNAIPAYLTANSTFNGSAIDIQSALLSTRILPLDWVLPLFACVPLFFLFSREFNGKFFTVPSLLTAIWLLVPLVLTQGYLVGFYIDYNRFLYFLILPIMILIAIVIDHGSGFFSRVIDNYRFLTRQVQSTKKSSHRVISRVSKHLTRKNIYVMFVLSCVLFAFFALPIFMAPSLGTSIQRFYQVMDDSGYEAINWAKQKTPVGSVFVADALYGWWFSGFAQRPTLSAVDPQYLTLEREFEPAKFARNLLDTDFLIDNGLIQVREDGGYVGRHNPMFLAKLNWTYFPYPFFHFNNSETTLLARTNGNLQSFDLIEVPVKEMRNESNSETSTIITKKGNGIFNYTQLTKVYQDVRFVDVTIIVESSEKDVSLDWLRLIVNIRGEPQLRVNNTVGLLDHGVKALGQLIFTKEKPDIYPISTTNYAAIELLYNLNGSSKAEIKLSIGAFSVSDSLSIYQNQETKVQFIDKLLNENLQFYHEKILDANEQPLNLPLETFDYKSAITANGVSYVICRGSEIEEKFAKDPMFSLVFINDNVAIFKVKGNHS